MVAVDWEGFRVDAAARFVAASDRLLLALAREVGLEDKLVRSRPPRPVAMGERRKEDMLSAPTLWLKLLTPTAREPIVVRKALVGVLTVETVGMTPATSPRSGYAQQVLPGYLR
jgi:protoporphyrinogen oxidase